MLIEISVYGFGGNVGFFYGVSIVYIFFKGIREEKFCVIVVYKV